MTGEQRLYSLRGLRRALTWLLAAIVLVDLFAVAAHLQRAAALGELGGGPFEGGLADVHDATGAVDTALALHLIGFIAVAAVFIVWQWRHAKNAEVLGTHGGLGAGWAIGGWFVPLANFVLPAVELSQASRTAENSRRSWILPWAITFGLAGAGWTSVLLMAPPTDDDSNLVLRSSQDVDAALASDRAAVLAYGLFAIAAVLAIVMIRVLTARQAAAVPVIVAPIEKPWAEGRWRYDRDLDESLRTGVWRWSTNVRRWAGGCIALFVVAGAMSVVSWEVGWLTWWGLATLPAWLAFRPRVVLSEDGADIRNLVNHRFVPWDEVARVEAHDDPDEGRTLYLYTTSGRSMTLTLGEQSVRDLGRRNRSDVLAAELALRAEAHQGREAGSLLGPATSEERQALEKRSRLRTVVAWILAFLPI